MLLTLQGDVIELVSGLHVGGQKSRDGGGLCRHLDCNFFYFFFLKVTIFIIHSCHIFTHICGIYIEIIDD